MWKLLLLLLAIMAYHVSAPNQTVAAQFVNSSTSGWTTIGPGDNVETFAHEVSGGDRVLIVESYGRRITSVTYKNIPLTQAYFPVTTLEAWYMLLPPGGTNDVVVTYDDPFATIDVIAAATSFRKVTPNSGLGNFPFVIEAFGVTSYSVDTNPTDVGNLLLGFGVIGSATVTDSSSQTSLIKQTNGSNTFVVSYRNSTQTSFSEGLTWTWPSSSNAEGTILDFGRSTMHPATPNRVSIPNRIATP